MNRRETVLALVALGVTAASRPPAAQAQQPGRMRQIGVLMGFSEGAPRAQANVMALRQGLQSLGWIEGRNIRIHIRWAGGDPEKARIFAKELVGMRPDLIDNAEH